MLLLLKLLSTFLLLSLTVLINAAGLTVVLRRVAVSKAVHDSRLWPSTWLLIRLAAWVVVLHVASISAWAVFYWWQGCLPNFESSLYFSFSTYTTVGYGDVVLPPEWRLVGGAEALTGILMCGLSIGLFLSVVTKIHALHSQKAD